MTPTKVVGRPSSFWPSHADWTNSRAACRASIRTRLTLHLPRARPPTSDRTVTFSGISTSVSNAAAGPSNRVCGARGYARAAECGLQKVIRISTLTVAALRHYPMSRPKFAAPSRATAIKGGIRPARERFTLDGREHDGSLAISRATVCLMAIFASSMLFEWSSAGRTSVIDHTASSCASYKCLCGFCHRSHFGERCSVVFVDVGNGEEWPSCCHGGDVTDVTE